MFSALIAIFSRRGFECGPVEVRNEASFSRSRAQRISDYQGAAPRTRAHVQVLAGPNLQTSPPRSPETQAQGCRLGPIVIDASLELAPNCLVSEGAG